MRNPFSGWRTWGSPVQRLHAGLAAVAYLPLLATRPGWVSADTKTYLYLDPGQLLGRAPSMWDPSIGMGTVTHQRIGFLWPMGPFFWLAETAGLPDWVAQRLWWGSIIFAAGAGVAYLLRAFGWTGPGVTAAVFTYALSPVILTLVARLSGVLLPFSGLPWLVAFTVQATRHRGWRHPALFALTAATFGSVNATGLLLVGVAPALWLPWAVWGAREARARQALLAGMKIGVLTLAVSAWWIAGLNVQRTHGLEIIRYTETAKVVASASVSHEVWRGLGYWFFYGRDRLGPWIEPSYSYTQLPPLLALTYLVPLLGIVGAALARWRHRSYFVLLILAGMALAVGAYPWDANPPWGHLLQEFQATDAGLSMRSLPRAVPLVALGTAVLLGAGAAAATRRWPHLRQPATLTSVALAVLALPPLWLGQFVPENLRRHEDLPRHWLAAADHLEHRDDGTRVLVLPGSDFAAYRWGNTVDPVLPGLMDRPSVQRETIPNGSPASANLLNAFDLRLQEDTASPAALAPIARLMRAGDLLVVSDWQYERNSLPEPRRLWDLVSEADGLGTPTELRSDRKRRQIERDAPPELAAIPVRDVPPIVTAQPTDLPLLVAGDGAGLVDAAAAGLIDGTELIRYSATLDDDAVAQALDDGAVLLLTDSHRKRGERWNTLRHNRGHTESAGESALATDLNDNRLPLFPEAGTDTMSVVQRRGRVSAQATSYGNTITYVPEERPMMAVDGDPATAWRTAAFADARGERLELTLDAPETADRVRLQQPDGDATRHITRVRLRFDGGDPLDVDLDDQSQEAAGQTITFPRRTFTSLSIEVLADSAGRPASFTGQSAVGFNEVEIGALPNEVDPELETVRLPTDLLDAAGDRSLDHLLAVSLTRQRQDPTDPAHQDEELSLVRSLTLPTARRFALAGEARLSPRADADLVDALLGRPHDGSVAWADASDIERGAAVSSAPLAFDGDATTSWATVDGQAKGQWVEVHLPEAVAVDALRLSVVADEDHSMPTEIAVEVDGEKIGRIELPPIDTGPEGTTVPVELALPAVTGRHFRLTLTGVDARVAPDAVYGDPVPPVAIAEVELPGPAVPTSPERFDTGCRDDLLRVQDRAVPVRVAGSTEAALAGKPLAVSLCDGGELALGRGPVRLAATRGQETGLDIDQLVLRSAPGGAASTGAGTTLVTEVAGTRSGDDAGSTGDTRTGAGQAGATGATGAAGATGEAGAIDEAGEARATREAGETGATGEATGGRGAGGVAARGGSPRIEVVEEGAARLRVRVDGAEPGTPFWLVLGQSYNTGWEATTGGAAVTGPELVDGFANGWLVTPSRASFDVTLGFAPQRRVDRALLVSLAAALACVALALRPARRLTGAPPARPAPLDARQALEYGGVTPGRATTAFLALGMASLAWFLAGPRLGLAVGLATAVATRHRRSRRWVLAGAAASLALAATYVCLAQAIRNPEPGLDWPFQTRLVHPLGWLAILLLVSDLAIDRGWRGRHGPHPLPTSNQMTEPDDVTGEGAPEAELISR